MKCAIPQRGGKRPVAAALVWAAAILLPGCGDEEKLPERAPVSGRVTLDGKPLVNASVSFYSENGGNPGQSSTDADGVYTLSTYETADGAVVGLNTATVERYLLPFPAEPGGKITYPKGGVPKKYNRPETSPLKFEVKPGERNVFDIAIDSK